MIANKESGRHLTRRSRRLMDKAKRRHSRARRNHLQLRRVILTCYFCFGSRHSKKMERVGGGWFVGQKPARFSLNAPSGRSNRLNLKQIWRRRVGVEPTIHPAKGRIAGFEDREDHRTPCASVYRQPVASRGIIPWGRTCDCCASTARHAASPPHVDVVWSQSGDRKQLILSSIFCGVSTSGRACTRSSAE